MTTLHELILSASDAEVLALMLGERSRYDALEAAAAAELADLLVEARLVPHEELPADRIAMNSKVTYEEEPGGDRRSVVLVHPIESDAAAGHFRALADRARAPRAQTRRAGSCRAAGRTGRDDPHPGSRAQARSVGGLGGIMRIHDGRIGAAIAGAMLIGLPAIDQERACGRACDRTT